MRACVYLLNNKPPYVDMAVNSIYMLRTYNQSIKVICLCLEDVALPKYLNVEKIPIKNLGNFFFTNKQHLGSLDYEDILYIDSDTFIFGNIEKLFDYEYDFVGCENTWAYFEGFNLFNPTNGGVLLYKNNAHKKVYYKFAEKLKSMEADYPELDLWIKNKNEWIREEFLTSQIVCDLSLSKTFFEYEHCRLLKWEEDFDKMHESVIFHSFTNQWNYAFSKISALH